MSRIRMDALPMAPIGFERAWPESKEEPAKTPRTGTQKFSLNSESFENGAAIPERLAGETGISPHLAWVDAPKDTARFVIIMDDPDAQPVVGHTFVHWVAALPGGRNSIDEGASTGGWTDRHKVLAGDGTSTAYRGPKPPSGTHRYHIAVYAMSRSFDDAEFGNLAGSEPAHDTRTYTRERFEALYRSDINASAEITGTYTAQPGH